MIVLNLAPEAAIGYAAFNALGDRARMTGEWLAFCQACPVPEIANVFLRCGIPFHQVTGTLAADDPAWAEFGEWAAAARRWRWGWFRTSRPGACWRPRNNRFGA